MKRFKPSSATISQKVRDPQPEKDVGRFGKKHPYLTFAMVAGTYPILLGGAIVIAFVAFYFFGY